MNLDLAGKCILLVEDHPLIALDTADMLSALGARETVIASSAAEALRILETADLDLAVLDVNLGADTSLLVAERLETNGIFFIFATGYGDTEMIPSQYLTVPIIRKPYTGAEIKAAFSKLLAGRS